MILFAMILAATLTQDDEAIPVRVRVAGGVHFVGQAFEVRVDAVAGLEAPEVEAPTVAGLTLTPFGRESRQVGSSGIGDFVEERSAHSTRFRVVAATPGSLVVPPFVLRAGDRVGRSPPTTIEIAAVPAEGRTGEFLGGVGGFELKAEAEPVAVPVGRPFEYRLEMLGPAAWGSTRPPDLAGFGKTPVRPEVEILPADLQDDPPRRIFRARLRPTKPGTIKLPPVFVVAFDPASRRYIRRAGPSVAIRVVETPEFDASWLVPRSEIPEVGPSIPALVSCLGIVAIGVVGVVTATVLIRRRRRRPAAFAARVARRLDGTVDPEKVGRAIQEGLAGYLNRATGRPAGALTPTEACEQVGRLTGDEALAGQAKELVEACDRARFSVRSGGLEALVTPARQFFRSLAARPV